MKPKHTILTGIFIAITFLSVFPPQPPAVHADLPVTDFFDVAVNTVSKAYNFITSGASTLLAQKETVLDPIAWAVAKTAIATMTKSMVNWINSGFNGSPAFVPNLQVYLGNMNFATANAFTNQLATNPAIASPFQSQVASLINLNFLKSSNGNGFFLQNPYTLNQVSPNDVGFVNGTVDFTSGGGWNAWFALTTQPQNNIYGATNLAQAELNSRLAAAQSNALTQLGWGQGFLSWCGNSSGGGGGASAGSVCKTDDDCGGALACLAGKCAVDASLGNPAGSCTNKDGSTGTIQTPGSVIQAQLNKTLGLTGDTLVTADEFNEVIGALMGQLVNQVIGPSGLSGVSSVSSGGTGYIDQATNEQSATTASGADATLGNAISGQLQQITQYQSDWLTIGNEASAANTSLNNCFAPPTDAAAAVATTTAQAARAATKATNGIAALNKVRNELTTAGTNSTAIAQAANDYQTLTSNASIPSASDVADADAQTQDVTVSLGTSTTTLSSLPLYSQMKYIVNQCSVIGIGP